jgi:hypothetical protein
VTLLVPTVALPGEACRLANLSGVVTIGAREWVGIEHAGKFIPVVWPHGTIAREQPVELLNSEGTVFVTEGEMVVLTGGFLPSADARGRYSVDQVFVAGQARANG